MGKTRAELLASLDSHELQEWAAYFRLEEWLEQNKGNAQTLQQKLQAKRGNKR